MNGGGNPSVGGGGFAASPAGTAPLYYKSAEIASGSAKNLCKKSEGVGGVCPARHRLDLPLWCLKGGGVPSLSPACPAFSFAFAPHPPCPLPGGKGENHSFLMQGASPLASPRLNPRGTGSTCRCGKLNGGLAPALPARRASAIPGGGLARLVARLPCLYLLFCPLSPCPLPRRGRGCPKVYFAGGFAPGTPAFNRLRHLQNLPSRYPAAEIRDCRKNDRKRFPMSSAGSQGEGGPGERNFGV